MPAVCCFQNAICGYDFFITNQTYLADYIWNLRLRPLYIPKRNCVMKKKIVSFYLIMLLCPISKHGNKPLVPPVLHTSTEDLPHSPSLGFSSLSPLNHCRFTTGGNEVIIFPPKRAAGVRRGFPATRVELLQYFETRKKCAMAFLLVSNKNERKRSVHTRGKLRGYNWSKSGYNFPLQTIVNLHFDVSLWTSSSLHFFRSCLLSSINRDGSPSKKQSQTLQTLLRRLYL